MVSGEFCIRSKSLTQGFTLFQFHIDGTLHAWIQKFWRGSGWGGGGSIITRGGGGSKFSVGAQNFYRKGQQSFFLKKPIVLWINS